MVKQTYRSNICFLSFVHSKLVQLQLVQTKIQVHTQITAELLLLIFLWDGKYEETNIVAVTENTAFEVNM